MSLYYPEEKKLTKDIVEAYVQGMWDLYVALGGESHCKSYDPLTISPGSIANSYVLDLEDGGRHHKFNSLEELKDMCLKEMVEKFK
jgi:hypothetical protein